MARPLDASTLELQGDAFPVAEQIVSGSSATGRFSASNVGSLVYQAGGRLNDGLQLTWFDRTGKPVGTVGPPGPYNDLTLSHDEKRVAVTVGNDAAQGDIAVIDLARNIPEPLTTDPALDWNPHWSHDDRHIIFSSRRKGTDNLYWKDSSGSGNEVPLLKAEGSQRPTDVSADGKFLLFTQNITDLWLLPLDPEKPGADTKPTLYFDSSRFAETQGQFSPGPTDGPRWVAYTSNESGRPEIWVQSFPVGAGKTKVSSGGGVQPRWSHDGKELFYISPERDLMAVKVKTSPKFEAGVPEKLFTTSMQMGGGATYVFRYAPSADGKRFLVASAVANEPGSVRTITVVLNWTARLKQ